LQTEDVWPEVPVDHRGHVPGEVVGGTESEQFLHPVGADAGDGRPHRDRCAASQQFGEHHSLGTGESSAPLVQLLVQAKRGMMDK
ncbi:hypothetical protein AVEN_24926-1, partial [Araneus ventricosus]